MDSFKQQLLQNIKLGDDLTILVVEEGYIYPYKNCVTPAINENEIFVYPDDERIRDEINRCVSQLDAKRNKGRSPKRFSKIHYYSDEQAVIADYQAMKKKCEGMVEPKWTCILY